MKQFLNPVRNWIARKVLSFSRTVADDEQWSRIKHELDAPSMLYGLLWLRDRGINLSYVIDGGACVGHWTRLLKRVYPNARVLMIEPQAEHQPELNRVAAVYSGGVEVVCTLVGAKEQQDVPFYVLDDGAAGTGSSVLAEISNVPRHVVRLPMTTLDKLAAERAWPVDLIKLDVQGFELEVLQGASDLLKTVHFVLLEVSVQQYNEGSPLMHDVLPWMHKAGFVVLDILDLSRRHDLLLQVDLLFVRRNSQIVNTLPLSGAQR